MRRFVVAITAVVLLALGGCGGREGADGSSIELRVLAWGTEGARLERMARQFTRENPGIDVRITSVPSSTAHDKLFAGIAAGEVPDVAVVGASWMPELAQVNALEEVPADIDQSQFLPAAVEAMQVDGKALGVPWFLDTRVLFYRTDIAEKAGITAAPTTWDELKAAAQAMQSKGGAKYGISLPTDSWHVFLPFVYEAGADLTDGQRVRFDTPEVAEASAYYKSFVDEGLTPRVSRHGFEIAPAFVRGTHPMFVSGAWQMRLISEVGGKAMDGRWAVAPMPRGRVDASMLGGGIWTVPKGGRHPAAGWKFVKWMSRPEAQAEWYTAVGGLPPSRAAWSLPAVADDPFAQVFRRQLDSAQLAPQVPRWQAISTAVEVRLDSLLRSDSDGRKMAAELEAAANTVEAG